MMKLFEKAFQKPERALCVCDNGQMIHYQALLEAAQTYRNKVRHEMVFVLCKNSPGSLLGYLGCLAGGSAALLLDADMDPDLLESFYKCYRPGWICTPSEKAEEIRALIVKNRKRTGQTESASAPDKSIQCAGRFCDSILVGTGEAGPPLHPDLCLLLTTSGSTGSPKLVRISRKNLDANTKSIVEYLEIDEKERPITTLPMNYSYGMSIINSHVWCGATILLTQHTLLERAFWDRMQKEGATSLAGVPYTYKILDRVGLTEEGGKPAPTETADRTAAVEQTQGMSQTAAPEQTQGTNRTTEPEQTQGTDRTAAPEQTQSMGRTALVDGADTMRKNLTFCPALHTLTQAGGKLPEKLHRKFGAWCLETGRNFVVMYGQTEASPRMGYLPAARTIDKCGSMGIAIPGGRLALINEEGQEILEPEVVGELVYYGENVSMGYALCREDLQKGDEFGGVLHTGDMARRDPDGYYYIVGRKKRFIKMAGVRIGLDETERLAGALFPEEEIVCTGHDDSLEFYVCNAEKARLREIADRISETIHAPRSMVTAFPIDEIPRNDAGKILYSELKK